MVWDSHAFEQCFRERYPELVQFLHGLTGDRAAGEDMAQEAFARLWTRGPQARPGADYWLFKVARNVALDWLKTEGRWHPIRPRSPRTRSSECVRSCRSCRPAIAKSCCSASSVNCHMPRSPRWWVGAWTR